MSAGTEIGSAGWIKSSYSDSSGGNCVELFRAGTAAQTRAGTAARTHVGSAARTVPVRDSKNPDGPVLHFSPSGWASFIAALKARHRPPAVPGPSPASARRSTPLPFPSRGVHG